MPTQENLPAASVTATISETKRTSSVNDPEDSPKKEPQISLSRRLKEYAFRKMPDIFPDPIIKEHLDHWREGDSEENKKTLPPDGELITLGCIWAVEIYTPSDTQKLITSLRTLGWVESRSNSTNDGPVEWIQRNRSFSLAGGWLNLGYIKRPGSGRIGHPLMLSAQLPEQIDHATASIFNLTSGITCVVVNFILNDSSSLILDRCLRQDRQTYAVRQKSGYSIIEPMNQKSYHVRSIRKELREAIGDWFRTNLPGFFSRGSLNGEFPTCEFTLLREGEPFPSRDASHKFVEYLHILRLDHDYGTWNNVQIKGLKFTHADFRDDNLSHHSILAIRESDFSAVDLSAWGGHKTSGYIAYLDRTMSGTMSRWGLLGLLSGFERTLSAVRDSTIFSIPLRAKPLRVLNKLGQLVSASVDISTISKDLQEFADKKGLFNHGIGDFTPALPNRYANNTTLEDVIRLSVADRATRLYESERIVRDLLVQHGTMLGTAENVRLQRQVTVLTWGLVALTIPILVLTATMAPNAWGKILGWIKLLSAAFY